MVELPKYPPLKPLHVESSLDAGKLAKMERVPTELLLASLVPGIRECLKTRPDYTRWTSPHPHSASTRRGCRQSSAGRCRKGLTSQDAEGTLLAR